jgi:hypothetical protein
LSYGAVVHAALAEKRSEQAARTARSERAAQLLRDLLPEVLVDGDVCPWAVWGVLNLWRRHGEDTGTVTVAMVRSERRELLRRFEQQRGYSPYGTANERTAR